jgi:hypothetical protein
MECVARIRRFGYMALALSALAAPSAAALILRTPPASGAGTSGFAVTSASTTAPAGFATVLKAGGNRIELRLTPNRVNARSWASVRVPSYDGATVRLAFASLAMHMSPATAVLHRIAPGRYAGRGPTLEMSGRWRIGVAPFGMSAVDRVAD